MDLFPDIEIVGLSLYLKKRNTLVIGDLHLGYEEAASRQGIFLPRFQLKDELKQLKDILAKLPKLDAVIINGDLKHEFGRISEQEWREILKMFDFILDNSKNIILIKGNHDVIIEPLAKKRNLDVVDYYKVDDLYLMHGHKIPDDDDFKKAKTIIIGNEHPAVSIHDKVRSEKFKCFLRGSWKNKNIIAMPSFNPVTIGTDVLGGAFISPILKSGVAHYEVFVVSDKVYDFGSVESLLRH